MYGKLPAGNLKNPRIRDAHAIFVGRNNEILARRGRGWVSIVNCHSVRYTEIIRLVRRRLLAGTGLIAIGPGETKMHLRTGLGKRRTMPLVLVFSCKRRCSELNT